ncbi:hypothetical protein [Streptomyces sp. NPDC019539]|uniref:hypothetical protein n=1 Tax=Streptomyces sp. NPDC019539 TaxID=3365063 RepID=UPI003798A480
MNDESIGTQTPARRITDPQEALAALESAVPGLRGLRRAEPVVPDWAVLEDGLGTALPADYKRLAEWYPTFALGDFVLVALPEPGGEHDLLHGVRGALDVLADAWLESDRGPTAHPAPGGLLPWAESNESDKVPVDGGRRHPAGLGRHGCLPQRRLVALRRWCGPVPRRVRRGDAGAVGAAVARARGDALLSSLRAPGRAVRRAGP